MAAKASQAQTRTRMDKWIDRAAGLAIGLGQMLPVSGQAALARSLSRVALRRHIRRAETELARTYPHMPKADVTRIARGAVENMARGIFEIADSRRLLARAADWTPTGPGLSVLDAAKAAGRPVILVTGHFGNWEAARAALTRQGHEIGGLYRPLNNGFLDDRWAAILSGLSGPVFPRGKPGLRGMLGHLKRGGHLVILPDQFFATGTVLDFLGRPAPTSLAAAEMALRFQAPLLPFYGLRRGAHFEVVLESPIPESTPEQMMQAVNDSLASRIAQDPDQWLWPHRRWKEDRMRDGQG